MTISLQHTPSLPAGIHEFVRELRISLLPAVLRNNSSPPHAACGIKGYVSTSTTDLPPLLLEGELLPKEEVLGGQVAPRPEEKKEGRNEVRGYLKESSGHGHGS